MWFTAYLKDTMGVAPTTSDDHDSDGDSNTTVKSSSVTMATPKSSPVQWATDDRGVDLALNHEAYGKLDAKCLEVEMSSTELLATPSASVRKRTIKVAMDSGAGDHVASPEDVEGFAIEASANSKAGGRAHASSASA